MTTEQQEEKFNNHIFIYPVYIIRAILWVPAVLIVHFLLRMEVRGRENIKTLKSGRVIFAANHCSEMDPYAFQYSLWFPSQFVPLYFVSLPKKYYPFSKYSFRSWYYGGIFFKLMGAYPVYKGLNNLEKAFTHHIKILEKNHPILMFPVGSKSNNKSGQARPGIVYLAQKTNAKVVPVKIEGTDNLTLKNILLRKKKIIITFGEPISPSTFDSKPSTEPTEEMKHWANWIMEKVWEV